MARTPTRTHTYRGHTIRPCSQIGVGHCDGRGWYIVAWAGNLVYAEELCCHYNTLADAKQSIDEWLAEEAAYKQEYMAWEAEERRRLGLPPDATWQQIMAASNAQADATYAEEWRAKNAIA